METDLFPAILCQTFMIEYSVITSDIVKSFDCICILHECPCNM